MQGASIYLEIHRNMHTLVCVQLHKKEATNLKEVDEYTREGLWERRKWKNDAIIY